MAVPPRSIAAGKHPSGKLLWSIEQSILAEEVETEDGGCAKIYNLDPAEQQESMFVRLQSWDSQRLHTTFQRLVGRRVRVTVELLD